VENILLRLIQAADGDISKAEHGIIYIDEIDKISRKSYNPSITRDVSGEGVQQALLKIIEGCVANVPPQGGRKHPHQEFMQIKTDNILFICGGTFDGLEEIVTQRASENDTNIGFKPQITKKDSTKKPESVYHLVNADDLLEYGFIPEFVGRLPILATLDPLDKNALLSVLTEPKNAVIKQYQALFGWDNVELEFTDGALEVAADESLKKKSGARALRSIIEGVLLGVMYELPTLKHVRKCIIDADVLKGLKDPILLTESGDIVELPIAEEKSA
jgi:ATP-dependent Clp protease ATP-binding subunit ClpX